VTAATAAIATNWACSSSNSSDAGAGDDGGTTSSSGSTTSSGTTTTTSSSGGSSSGCMLETLANGPTGYVAPDMVTNIVGAWYGYGDMWGPNGAPPGNCQTIGMFMDSQCSTITFPLPGMPSDAGPDAGYVATFPPGGGPGAPSGAPTGAQCLSGTAAKVLACNTGVAGCSGSDYSDIFGIGIGLDFNNMGGNKQPFNATMNNVTGFEFDITGVPAGGVRVEFPTVDTSGGTTQYEAYAKAITKDGHYRIDLSTSTTDTYAIGDKIYTAPTGQPSFDPTKLLSIQFHVPTATGGAVMVPLMCVNNLSAILGTCAQGITN
jgi:hypothetical protein